MDVLFLRITQRRNSCLSYGYRIFLRARVFLLSFATSAWFTVIVSFYFKFTFVNFHIHSSIHPLLILPLVCFTWKVPWKLATYPLLKSNALLLLLWLFIQMLWSQTKANRTYFLEFCTHIGLFLYVMIWLILLLVFYNNIVSFKCINGFCYVLMSSFVYFYSYPYICIYLLLHLSYVLNFFFGQASLELAFRLPKNSKLPGITQQYW